MISYRRRILITVVVLAAAGALGLVLAPRHTALSQEAKKESLHIVSLAPSITEIVFALGLGDSLVGVTQYCDFPPEAKKIARVGGFGSPSLEPLLALKPDIVIAAGLERKDIVPVLQSAGINVLDVQIRNFDELFAAIQEIGRYTHRPAQAALLVANMRGQLDAVSRRFAGIPHDRRPRVFAEIWHSPLTTAGGPSFLNDMIQRAGGVNVAAKLTQPHPRINAETVIQWNPDVIVTSYMGRGGEAAAQVAGRIGWAQINAVKNGRIIDDISADILLRPGPRLVQGVEALAQHFYPDTVPATTAASSAQEGGK